jgi:hypothetical protein
LDVFFLAVSGKIVAFVEMELREAADAAIDGLNGARSNTAALIIPWFAYKPAFPPLNLPVSFRIRIP